MKQTEGKAMKSTFLFFPSFFFKNKKDIPN